MDDHREFPPTSWSILRHAAEPGSPEYQEHLERLVKRYWRPIHSVIRHGWRTSEADATDLTQEFFAVVVIEGALSRTFAPARGSFRALLRAAITNFMRNVVRDAGRQKRGGDLIAVSWEELTDGAEDALTADDLFGGGGNPTPEQIFDRAWSQVVMKQAMALLERRLIDEGRASALEAFKRHDLCEGDRRLSYAAVGEAVGLSGPQVMHALRHARETFRAAVTEIVSQYADGPEEIAAEIQSLFEG